MKQKIRAYVFLGHIGHHSSFPKYLIFFNSEMENSDPSCSFCSQWQYIVYVAKHSHISFHLQRDESELLQHQNHFRPKKKEEEKKKKEKKKEGEGGGGNTTQK